MSTELPGTSRALTEQDLEPLLDANLEPDLAPWRKRAPLRALDLLDFVNQIDTEWPSYRRNFIAIVAVRQGRWRWWAYPSARQWCTRRVRQLQGGRMHAHGGSTHAAPDPPAHALCTQVAAAQAEIEGRFLNKTLQPSIPDTVFIFNAYDKPLCATPGANNTLLGAYAGEEGPGQGGCASSLLCVCIMQHSMARV